MAVVDEGVYTISVMPVASTLRKFDFMNIKKISMYNLFDGPCFSAEYNYLI